VDPNTALSAPSQELTISSESGQLLRMAIEKDLDVEKLKALMDLRDREDRRKAERDFENHFAEMQRDYIPAFKSKSVETANGKTAYSYCPLPRILAVYAPILARHGFSYRWEESELDGKLEKKTTCFLSGYGFSRHASISLPYGATNQLINSIQARGATSEYGRRYTFMNVTGCIVADETDTDGIIPEQPSAATPAPASVDSAANPKPASASPASTQSSQAKTPTSNNPASSSPFESKKLKPETISQAVDLMNELGWSMIVQRAKVQWGESVGDDIFLERIKTDYRTKKGQVCA
jgi:hypothetical protein